MKRLPFSLPAFVRLAWVSERAKTAWEPRIERIQNAWRVIEQESVVQGIRRCAILSLNSEQLVSASKGLLQNSLFVLPLQRILATPGVYQSGVAEAVEGAPYLFRVVVGTADSLRFFQASWDGDDDDAIGALLGYPPCCRSAFRFAWAELRLIDPTWLMAGGAVGDPQSTSTRVPPVLAEANVLARFIGVRAVPHLPCRFDCQESAELGRRLLELGRSLGYDQEMAWLKDILAWPYEWSALHGIAEVRTPVLKVATATDATATEYVVRIQGSVYPVEGGSGVRFPYRAEDRPVTSTWMSVNFTRPVQ